MELHPMRSLRCSANNFNIDTRQQLAAHSDIGYKTAGQISTLARTFRLFIRRVEHPDSGVLDRIVKENLDDQWVEVPFPVAWIVFGKMP